MTMRRTHNITVTTGEYEKEGQQKKKRVTIGSMMTDDQSGNMSICLELPPAFKLDNDGYPIAWLQVFPIDNQNNQQQAFGTQPSSQPAPQMQAQAPQPVQQPMNAPQPQQVAQQPQMDMNNQTPF